MRDKMAIRVDGVSKRFAARRVRSSARQVLEDAVSRRNEQQRQKADGDFWALRDVSFELREGEILAVVGSNGAGKSVLLRILAKVTRPTEGRAVVCGRVAPLLQLGAGFHPDLTGRDNIFFNGSILGMRRREIQRRVDEIVEFSGMEAFLGTPLRFYSSGMRMRLAFSVAAHLDRDIFLLDEALAVGDIAFKEKCAVKLREITAQGRTILLVAHGDAAMEGLATRAILLDEGRLVASGNPVQVNAEYRMRRETRAVAAI